MVSHYQLLNLQLQIEQLFLATDITLNGQYDLKELF